MRTRTTVILLATTAALLAGCSSEPSYDESTTACIAAVNKLPKGAQVQPRPKACEPLEEKDYNLIFASKTIKDAGITPPPANP